MEIGRAATGDGKGELNILVVREEWWSLRGGRGLRPRARRWALVSEAWTEAAAATTAARA